MKEIDRDKNNYFKNPCLSLSSLLILRVPLRNLCASAVKNSRKNLTVETFC
jgi:hypothetical protein